MSVGVGEVDREMKKLYISMFAKMLTAFVLLGLVPLLLTGQMLYSGLASGVEDVMVGNASQMAVNIGRNASELIEKYDDITRYLYEWTSEEYTFFYDLLEDTEINAQEREQEIAKILYSMLSMEHSIENIRFIYDKVYSVSRDTTKNLDTQRVLATQWKPGVDEMTMLYIMPTHSDGSYYYHSQQKVFTLARNYMDVSTMRTARTKRMGTLYIDIDSDSLKVLEEGLHMGENSRIMVVDSADGSVIYSRDADMIANRDEQIGSLLGNMEGTSGIWRTDDSVYAYCGVENTRWKVIVTVSHQDIRRMYLNSSWFVLGMLGVSGLILLLFFRFSRHASRPVEVVKDAMCRIQEGALDTRVEIRSHDEMQILGEGLNEMASSLQRYIDRVYVAELRQKEAQLEALKSAIKPHYLYNTLEVIRMTAVSEGADRASELITSLSRQLRYLIGNESDQVTLAEELDNIREYFSIVRVRYEEQYDLEIDVPADCQRLKVLKLILQPIVENAVKHGLRPKKDEGMVQISAVREADCLRITVMDDGVGMPKQKVEELTAMLITETPIQSREESDGTSIGIKNTYDRIVKNYGDAYGFRFTSCEGMGTVVEYRLPVLEE